MTTKQVAERLIDTARKHIAAMGGSGMKSSAVSALSDSLVQMKLNDFECAAGRALDSLSYSIGRLHPDYQNALTVASSAAKRDGMLERLGFRIEHGSERDRWKYVKNEVRVVCDDHIEIFVFTDKRRAVLAWKCSFDLATPLEVVTLCLLKIVGG